MLLEKKPVSKRKMAFFALACRFFHWARPSFSLWRTSRRAECTQIQALSAAVGELDGRPNTALRAVLAAHPLLEQSPSKPRQRTRFVVAVPARAAVRCC